MALASFVDVSLPSHFLHSLFPNLTINSQFFVSKIHGKLHRYLHKMLFITAGCRIRKKILINNTKFFMQTLTIDIRYHTVVMQLNEMQFSICSTNYEIQMLSQLHCSLSTYQKINSEMFERAVKYKLQKKFSEKQKVVKTNLYLVVNTPVREMRTSMLQLTPKYQIACLHKKM